MVTVFHKLCRVQFLIVNRAFSSLLHTVLMPYGRNEVRQHYDPQRTYPLGAHALRLTLHTGTRANVEINSIFMLRPASGFQLV